MKALPWISPSAVDAMLYNEPMASPDFGFSLMRPKAKTRKNSTADLARAKLQPSKPGDAAWGPDGLWPITCATSRLVVAPGVALEPDALETVFEGYDTRVKAHQKLLAVVLTMKFDHGWQPSDILSLVGAYALKHLALGITGKGVTIAIMDTGIDVDGVEFKGRLSADSTALEQKVARCGNCAAETIRFSLDDKVGHGSQIAAIAAGARDGNGMHGVAPDATILAIKINGPNLDNASPTSGVIPEAESANAALIAPAIRYAVEKGAFAISFSLNGFATGMMAADQRGAMDQVRLNNRLFVNSVSNDKGQDSYAGQIVENLVGTDLGNKDWFLFAIRVDQNLRPPTDNGVPGALADRTLTTVALGIPTVGKDGEDVTVNGNSFAAPAVAGAAALLKQYWPKLGGKEISRILLDTATDLGAPGVDQVYGVGLLDIEKAMKAQAPASSFVAADAVLTRFSSLSGDAGGPVDALTIDDWPRSGLPWIAFWLKELVNWGTLDPVAAFRRLKLRPVQTFQRQRGCRRGVPRRSTPRFRPRPRKAGPSPRGMPPPLPCR
ncbi:S8 family serine peptidase [Sphingomonas sp. 2378]|uniref:S8 family serine peptidase n=1 Tax=Sphingomonas sp. 2378 TaxID=1219748 RepID=UPI00311B0023